MHKNHNKSIMDSISIKTNEEYDRIFGASKSIPQGQKVLVIVSDCPECGAPIYGQKQVKAGETPDIQFSCQCSTKKGLAGQTCIK